MTVITGYVHLELRKRRRSAARRRRYIAQPRASCKPVERVDHVESGNMPDWCKSRDGEEYWDAADENTRSNGRRFFELEVGLPKGLSLPQQADLARAFIAERSGVHEFMYGKMPWTLAIHGSTSDNPHFHVMLSPSINDGIARTAATWFRRYSKACPERGGARKSRDITRRGWLLELRERWEQVANQFLVRWLPGVSIDCRSNAERRPGRLPSLHLGPRPSQRRVDRNAEIAEENARREREELEAAAILREHAERILSSLGWWRYLQRCLRFNRWTGMSVTEERIAAEALIKWGKAQRLPWFGSSDDAAEWTRSLELIVEPAYQFAASRRLGAGWIGIPIGPVVAWTHDIGDAIVDVGGAVIAVHDSALEKMASQVLIEMRAPPKLSAAATPSPSKSALSSRQAQARRSIASSAAAMPQNPKRSKP